MDRRHYLALAGSGVVASVAGCLGGNGDSDDDTNNSDDGNGGGNTTNGDDNGTPNGNETESTDDATNDGTSDTGDDGTDDSSDSNGADESSPDEPAGGPIAVVERYFELRRNNQDVESIDEVVALLEPIFHSQSPFIEFIENSEQRDVEDREDQSVPTDPDLEITERDLSVQEITNSYSLTFLPYIEEADLDIIDGNNALVQRTTTTTSGDTETERTQYFWVTQEDGDWVIFATYSEEVTSG